MSDLPTPVEVLNSSVYDRLVTRDADYIDINRMWDDDEMTLHVELLRRYANGRLIDGQAIKDAWRKSRQLAPENGREFAEVIALLDALTEEER